MYRYEASNYREISSTEASYWTECIFLHWKQRSEVYWLKIVKLICKLNPVMFYEICIHICKKNRMESSRNLIGTISLRCINMNVFRYNMNIYIRLWGGCRIWIIYLIAIVWCQTICLYEFHFKRSVPKEDTLWVDLLFVDCLVIFASNGRWPYINA